MIGFITQKTMTNKEKILSAKGKIKAVIPVKNTNIQKLKLAVLKRQDTEKKRKKSLGTLSGVAMGGYTSAAQALANQAGIYGVSGAGGAGGGGWNGVYGSSLQSSYIPPMSSLNQQGFVDISSLSQTELDELQKIIMNDQTIEGYRTKIKTTQDYIEFSLLQGTLGRTEELKALNIIKDSEKRMKARENELRMIFMSPSKPSGPYATF